MLLEQVAEVENRCLVRHWLAAPIDARKAPQHERLIQRVLDRRVRQRELGLQTIDPQHDVETNRLTPHLALRAVR